jgi:hypothetical protein
MPGRITISREQWQAVCIERTRMQRVVEAARDVSDSCGNISDIDALDAALRDLDALAGQDKDAYPRCNDTGVATDGDVEICECGAGTSPYKPGAPVVRRMGQLGVVVLDDDGEV